MKANAASREGCLALLIRSDLTPENGLGFNTRGVVSFRVPLPGNHYDDAHRRASMIASRVQRTRELGVRMALGATRGQVMTLVLSQSARSALIGIAAGIGGALALTRVLTGLAVDPLIAMRAE